jgi:hypothetical protein
MTKLKLADKDTKLIDIAAQVDVEARLEVRRDLLAVTSVLPPGAHREALIKVVALLDGLDDDVTGRDTLHAYNAIARRMSKFTEAAA